MKVTGWTYWEDDNEKYIDTIYEWRKLISPALDELHSWLNFGDANYEKERDAIVDDCTNKFLELKLPTGAELEECVIEEIKNKGYIFTGNYHQNGDYGTPIIDDKYIYRVSQRTWGDIIAQTYPDKIDDSDGYGYIDWAWTVPEGEKEVVPYEETSNS